MSESWQPTLSQPAVAGVDADAAEEVFDALPVLAGEPLELQLRSTAEALPDARRSGIVLPAVQAAAVAAGGFVAGAAVVGLVHRHQRRAGVLGKPRGAGQGLARKGRRAGVRDARRRGVKAGELVQIVGTRSLLVDVHLLGGPGEH